MLCACWLSEFSLLMYIIYFAKCILNYTNEQCFKSSCQRSGDDDPKSGNQNGRRDRSPRAQAFCLRLLTLISKVFRVVGKNVLI